MNLNETLERMDIEHATASFLLLTNFDHSHNELQKVIFQILCLDLLICCDEYQILLDFTNRQETS